MESTPNGLLSRVSRAVACAMIPVVIVACSPHGSDDPIPLVAAAALLSNAACQARALQPQANRSFSSSFEAVSDFAGYYLVPQNYQSAATHELSTSVVRTGTNAHRGLIYASTSCATGSNCNHRGYPTIQLHKTPGGFSGNVMIEFYVHLNMTIPSGQWFSFATMSADSSDAWNRTVLVNLASIQGGGNYMHLMHVPLQGQGVWTYQVNDSSPVAFPMNQWVKVNICVNFHLEHGFARVWQNDTLVSSAAVRGGCGILEQAHFGLYASPGLSSGTVYNDDLSIREVATCPN